LFVCLFLNIFNNIILSIFRLKEDVLTDLPKKTRKSLPIEISFDFKKLLKDVMNTNSGENGKFIKILKT